MEITEIKFAPGCALMLYKPGLSQKVFDYLKNTTNRIEYHLTCCKHEPGFIKNTQIINICPGCNKRVKDNYTKTSTLSLWEFIAKSKIFPFPDYKGKTMTIMDACPVRSEPDIHNAIRVLLKRMNINIVEPLNNREKSVCCGDSFYGTLPVNKVLEQMKKRADELPANDVVVYCVSCIKSVYNGGKTPHYLVDLLFNETTIEKTTDPDLWHQEIDDYISNH